MRTASEVRDWAAAARAHDAAVEANFARARAIMEASNASNPKASVTQWCNEKGHRAGQRQKLAEIHALPFGMLFVSRISWMVSDQLNLRPWAYRQRLIDLEPLCGSDDMLMKEVADLDQKAAGVLPGPLRPRWLVDVPPSFIHDDLMIVAPDVIRPALWVRCPDHPADAHALDRSRLVAQTRKAAAAKSRH